MDAFAVELNCEDRDDGDAFIDEDVTVDLYDQDISVNFTNQTE